MAARESLPGAGAGAVVAVCRPCCPGEGEAEEVAGAASLLDAVYVLLSPAWRESEKGDRDRDNDWVACGEAQGQLAIVGLSWNR